MHKDIASKLLAALPWDILIGEEKEVIKPDTLVKYYQNSCSHDKDLAIGFEYERSGVYPDILKPVAYKGSWGRKGYLDILKRLNEELGWEIIWQENGDIKELRRSGTRITLESDGRLEMSSKPRTNLHDLAHEFMFYNREITEVSKIFGIAQIGIGLQPFHKSEEIPFYENGRGPEISGMYKNDKNIVDCLKKANGLHINFDYLSEEDAVRKTQLMWRLSSIIAAMFAFSPINNGEDTGYLDYRLILINGYDSKRTALQKEFLRKDFSFKKWIDYCLDLPIMYIMREGKRVYPKKTFRKFIEEGYNGLTPTIRDFNLHLKSVWSEVRLRKYIELRSIDSVPPFLIMSAPALIKGLLYGKDAIDAAEKLVGDFDYNELMELRKNIIKDDLMAEIRGKKVIDYAKELISIANANLKSFKNLDEKEEDESVYLEPIKEFIFVKEKSPARYVLEKWKGEWGRNASKLIEWCVSEKSPL